MRSRPTTLGMRISDAFLARRIVRLSASLTVTSGEPVQARRSRSSASLYGQSSSCAGRKSRRSNRPNLYAVGEQSPANETIDRVLQHEEQVVRRPRAT